MEPEPLLLAYCAGVIDSDGCIRVRKSTYAMRVRGDAKAPVYSESIQVKQVEPQAIDLLHALFRGYRRVESNSLKNGRPFHAWTVTDLNANKALVALLPYLKIKKEQALNCLDLRVLKETAKTQRVARGRGHAGSASRAPELSAAMEETFLKGKRLNKVGK